MRLLASVGIALGLAVASKASQAAAAGPAAEKNLRRPFHEEPKAGAPADTPADAAISGAPVKGFWGGHLSEDLSEDLSAPQDRVPRVLKAPWCNPETGEGCVREGKNFQDDDYAWHEKGKKSSWCHDEERNGYIGLMSTWWLVLPACCGLLWVLVTVYFGGGPGALCPWQPFAWLAVGGLVSFFSSSEHRKLGVLQREKGGWSFFFVEWSGRGVCNHVRMRVKLKTALNLNLNLCAPPFLFVNPFCLPPLFFLLLILCFLNT